MEKEPAKRNVCAPSDQSKRKPEHEKKKRKKKRRRKLDKYDNSIAEGQPSIEVDLETTLEGRMVDNKMILIDRSSCIVYSGSERTVEGRLLRIGFFDAKADSISYDKPIDAETNFFPFPVDSDDHCETPEVAYQHVAPCLHAIAQSIGASSSSLSIYDPYFCDGSVVCFLSQLGFPCVRNKKENCYEAWQSVKCDVLITNPPYSGDHIEQLVHYLTQPSRLSMPWLLLLPQWVHKKDYFITAMQAQNLRPFYLVPKKRYVYVPPKDFRPKKNSATHKKSSPFVTMWYVWGGSRDLTQHLYDLCAENRSQDFDVARSKSALRDLRRKLN